MKRTILRALATAGLSASMVMFAVAQGPELKDPVPATHTVVKGDTLWDISDKFLKNPWMWPEIWHVNAQIENPHLIYPGDVIRLIYVDGQPRLTLDTSGRMYKLTPKARVISAGDAIETIPLGEINSFLSRSRIVSKQELKLAPHVITGKDDHLVTGAGDRVYVRGDIGEDFSVYGIYRRGQEFRDPVTRERLGIQAIDIGSGQVRGNTGEVGTLEVLRSNEEVRIGDKLLREEERAIDSSFYPSPPTGDIDGFILAVEGGVSQVGKMDVVVINKGEREGIAPGNVLAVYKKGGKIKDRVKGDFVELPDERAGLLMVFKVFDKVAFGLVLEASLGLSINDVVTNP